MGGTPEHHRLPTNGPNSNKMQTTSRPVTTGLSPDRIPDPPAPTADCAATSTPPTTAGGSASSPTTPNPSPRKPSRLGSAGISTPVAPRGTRRTTNPAQGSPAGSATVLCAPCGPPRPCTVADGPDRGERSTRRAAPAPAANAERRCLRQALGRKSGQPTQVTTRLSE